MTIGRGGPWTVVYLLLERGVVKMESYDRHKKAGTYASASDKYDPVRSIIRVPWGGLASMRVKVGSMVQGLGAKGEKRTEEGGDGGRVRGEKGRREKGEKGDGWKLKLDVFRYIGTTGQAGSQGRTEFCLRKTPPR